MAHTLLFDRFKERPLYWLTVIALIPRLVAVVFSGGYFAHDDHFLMIEAAQSWVDGYDYNNWLPWNQGADPHPTGHMMLYPGLHYLLFKLCHFVGLDSPQGKMMLVRLLHALWSLIVVRVGYRILRRLSTPQVAWQGGLLLALFFFMPFFSVHNLVEVVSIPPLMLCAWWLIRRKGSPTLSDLLIAGMFAGLAIDFRFQTVFFGLGAGLGLLLGRNLRGALTFGAGMLLPVILVQAGVDLFIWHRPFAEMTEYVRYNLEHSTTYFDQPWYNYLLVLVVLLIPPFSLALLFGFFKRPRPLALWLAVMSFLVIHSLFPNKQERFILSIVPLVLVLGLPAWEAFRLRSRWWQKRTGLWRGVMTWTWAINLLLLVPLTLSYGKRERVEAMLLLRSHPLTGLIIEDSVVGSPPMMPLFYAGQWGFPQFEFTDAATDPGRLQEPLAAFSRANAVIFLGEDHLDERVSRIGSALGPLTFIGVSSPGLIDRVAHWFNPKHNRSTHIFVYAIDRADG